MAKKPVPASDPAQEEEMSVVVLKFKGSGETLRRGMDTVAAAIAALGNGAHVTTRTVNGRKPLGQIVAPLAADAIDAEPIDTLDESEDSEEETTPAAPKAKKAPGTPKYSFLPDFELGPAGKTSLKDFVAGKTAATEADKYLLVCWWLQTDGGTDPFTGNHLFTCFRALNWKPRLDVNQPVRELKSKKSFFDSPTYGKWRLTQPGLDAAAAVQ